MYLSSNKGVVVGALPRAKWDLHLLACRTLLKGSLTQSSPIQLPCWLTQHLLSSRDGPAVPLLRLFLEYNRLQEAYRLAVAMLSASIGPNNGKCQAI